tara:strand:- start:153 stop:461 length:309 start_codon:yes stop_codon:yes gene_type:complete
MGCCLEKEARVFQKKHHSSYTSLPGNSSQTSPHTSPHTSPNTSPRKNKSTQTEDQIGDQNDDLLIDITDKIQKVIINIENDELLLKKWHQNALKGISTITSE